MLVALLVLASCSPEPEANQDQSVPAVAVSNMPGSGTAAKQASLLLPVPQDRAQLERMLSMGYTVHEDHLHAPGVTACPKMSEDPVK
jgi:hypothetical protein